MAYSSARTTNWDQLRTYFELGDLDLEMESDASYSDSDSSRSDAGAEELVEDEPGL